MSDEGCVQSSAAAATEASKSMADNGTGTKPTEAPDPAVMGAEPTPEEARQAAESAEDEASKHTRESSNNTSTKPTEDSDLEMKEAPSATPPAEMASTGVKTQQTEVVAPAAGVDKTNASTNKTHARRKSAAGTDTAKGKKLNKKASKPTILHIDARPGQHYFIKLKGYPQWPCIICDEDMLPQALIKSRPVSAARADGTYREDFADGGKQAANRTFPIMYLATNEFGWVSNRDLVDLDPDKVVELITPKMRKDLQLAHEIAAEKHDLDYFRGVLQEFQEELIKKQKAAEAKAAEAATPKKNKKLAKSYADLEDVEMQDADNEPPTTKSKKSDKKRKTIDNSDAPQRPESVKKPKIKLTNNSTPKAANGATPKSVKANAEAKKKTKKAAKELDDEDKAQSPKEPELSAEDRFERKKKEVLFLRHKLQKGLLTRDQLPKEDEVKVLSDYLAKLEQLPDLETDIIRATKINKVLKAVLKLDSIPKEEDFNFKPRSQVLLEKWNRLLQAEEAGPATGAEEANGVNGHSSEIPIRAETKTGVNGGRNADTDEPKAKNGTADERKPAKKDTEKKGTVEPLNEGAAAEEKTAGEE